MGFDSMVKKEMKFPIGATDRFKRLVALRRLLEGTFYNDLPYEFSDERTGGGLTGKYVSLLKRKPSSPYNLARIVTDQTSGLMWGGEQMPFIRVGDDPIVPLPPLPPTPVAPEPPNPTTDPAKPAAPTLSPGVLEHKQALHAHLTANTGQTPSTDQSNVEAIFNECDIDVLMMELYEVGQPGCAAIILSSDEEKGVNFEIIPGEHCMPVYDPKNPAKLQYLTVIYPTTARALKDLDYRLDDNPEREREIPDDTDYWFRLDYGQSGILAFLPMSGTRYANIGKEDAQGKIIEWERDAEKDVEHGWRDVVPVVYVRNLIGNAPNSKTDGRCTYGDIVDIQIEIAYTLSMIGRGFRYTADPLLVRKRGELDTTANEIDPLGMPSREYKDPDNPGATLRDASNVLDAGIDGDAKLLEITGQGLAAAGEHVKVLREWALEVVGAMKSDASTTKGVTSGRALEMLYQALFLLIKRQRLAYGKRALVPLIRLILDGCKKNVIEVDGVKNANPKVKLNLKWPRPMTPHGSELLAEAQAWETLAGGSAKAPVPLLPRDQVAALAANEMGFNDATSIVAELHAQEIRAELTPDDTPIESADLSTEIGET